MVKIGFVAGALALLSAAPAIAQTPMAKPVKLGVVTDMSGSLSAQSGIGSVVAAEMAREDCLAGPCKGMSIEIVSAPETGTQVHIWLPPAVLHRGPTSGPERTPPTVTDARASPGGCPPTGQPASRPFSST